MFTSDMLEDDIIQHVSKQFPVVESSILFPKFSFSKAVYDSQIEPDIKCWDYSTVKHIAGQGPIYVRVHKKLKVKGDLLDDDSDSEDNEIHFPSVAAYKKEGLLKANSNTEKIKLSHHLLWLVDMKGKNLVLLAAAKPTELLISVSKTKQWWNVQCVLRNFQFYLLKSMLQIVHQNLMCYMLTLLMKWKMVK